MEITWYGLSCFRLSERGFATVITDPYDHQAAGYEPLKLKADIVTISQDTPERNCTEAIEGQPYQITGPGEYEVGNVFVTGVQMNHSPEKGVSTLYVFDFNGLTVAHLGDLDRLPTQAEIETIGTVNVVLVPIGNGNNLSAGRATEAISLLEPNIVIPMHYATPDCKLPLESLSKFLKEMGISEIETQANLKITSASLPEAMQVCVLDYHNT